MVIDIRQDGILREDQSITVVRQMKPRGIEFWAISMV